jgi:hypothetical protein
VATSVVSSAVKRSLSLLAVVVLAIGCGSDGEDMDTSVSVPPGPAPADPGGGGARVVSPTPGLDGVVPAAIDSARALDGNKLEVRFYSGVEDCYGLERVDVEESDAEVLVSVFTGSRPEARDVACIEIAELVATVVTLDAPLGDRTVVDASTGAPVPVG